jgi:hypothetical protein
METPVSEKQPSKTEVRIEELTKQVLQLVHDNPTLAFAMGIGRLLRTKGEVTNKYLSLENNIGSALRLLEQRGMLISTLKAKHPEVRSGRVRLYRLTALGLQTLAEQTPQAA